MQDHALYTELHSRWCCCKEQFASEPSLWTFLCRLLPGDWSVFV